MTTDNIHDAINFYGDAVLIGSGSGASQAKADIDAAIAEHVEAEVARAASFAGAICDRVGARERGAGGNTVESGTARLYADAARRIDLLIDAAGKQAAASQRIAALTAALDHATALLLSDYEGTEREEQVRAWRALVKP